jgi:16S rRNA (cytosine967-C5)-methyltransferase
VYSTCTISPVENERVVTGFLAVHEDFAAADLGADAPVWKHPTMPQTLQTLPHRDRTDGFFVAKLVRA